MRWSRPERRSSHIVIDSIADSVCATGHPGRQQFQRKAFAEIVVVAAEMKAKLFIFIVTFIVLNL